MWPKIFEYLWEISASATFFWKLVHSSHWKSPLVLRKFRFSGYLSKTKKEERNQKDWHVCHKFGIIKPFSATYFPEVGAQVSLNVTTKGSIWGKKIWKCRFLGCFSKRKTEECDQKFWNIFYQFSINIPCSATYFLEVGVRLSLKVANKGCIRGKKNSENLDS